MTAWVKFSLLEDEPLFRHDAREPRRGASAMTTQYLFAH
jgi:hypothetical protein